MFWCTYWLILWAVCYTGFHVQGVSGVITVTTSAVTGIPNEKPLRLRCNYTADEPLSFYIWERKNGSTLTKVVDGSISDGNAVFWNTWLNKGVFVGDHTSTLDIRLPAKYVTSSFAGTYSCLVSGVDDYFTRSEVYVSVLSAPIISGIPSPYRVIESTRLMIDCSSYIPSSTSYAWTKGRFFSPRGSAIVSTDGVLDINSINRTQAGQYTCTATNTQGLDSTTTTVDVQYAPTMSGIPSTYQVIQSASLRIDCSNYTTVGNPPVTSYTWTKGGSAVESTDGVLDVSSISKDQAGQYTCTATNTLTPTGVSQQPGTATGQFNVDVQFSPATNAVAAAAGGILAGVMVVIIFVAIIILYKRRTFSTIASSQENRRHNEQNATVSSDPRNTYSDLDHSGCERRTYTGLMSYQNLKTSAGDGDVALYEGIQEKSYENIQMPTSEKNTADNNKESVYQNASYN